MKKKDESLGFAIYAVAKSSIAQSTWQQISIATLGSSGSVQKGDAAVVLGKPFGYAGAVGFGTIASSRNELDGDDGSYPLLCTDIGAAEDGDRCDHQPVGAKWLELLTRAYPETAAKNW